MKKHLIFVLGALVLAIIPISAGAYSTGSELTINKDGVVSVTGARVAQLAGQTFFARLYWGDAFIRFTIKTNSTTKFSRATGEATSISEISEGDLLDLTGTLESGSNTLDLVATTVKNSSVQKKQSVFSGKVTDVDLNARTFMLNAKNTGMIKVVTGTTTQFTKGSRTLDLEHVRVGDTITKVAGDYDLSNKSIVAQSVLTYLDPNYYKPKNFEGKLTSVTGTTVPTSIKVMIDKTEYTVNITDSASVMNRNRNSALLSRFVVGDTIRIYGAIREVDDAIIDATLIRNTSL